MRIILAIEVAEGESYSAEAPFDELDLLKSPGKLSELYAQPMFKALLEGFEEELPDDREERTRVLNRGLRRSIELFRARQGRPLNG